MKWRIIAVILVIVIANPLYLAARSMPEALAEAMLSPSPAQAKSGAKLSPEEKQEKIEELLRKANKEKDVEKQKKYYQEILDLDPAHPIARGELEKIKAKQEEQAKKEKEEKERLETEKRDKERKKLAKQQALDMGIQALVLDEAEPLQSAVEKCKEALVLNSSDSELMSLNTRLEDRVKTKKMVFWAQIAALVVLALASLGVLLYFLLRKRRGVLRVIEGAARGQTFVIDKDQVTLGALEGENNFFIPDPHRRISRAHCEIFRAGRRLFYIKDTSTNGTKINGHDLEKDKPVRLRKGDQITLADDVILVFGLKF